MEECNSEGSCETSGKECCGQGCGSESECGSEKDMGSMMMMHANQAWAELMKEKMKKNVQVVGAMDLVKGRGTAHWLELNVEAVSGRVTAMLKREDINLSIQERMIVELYSK